MAQTFAFLVAGTVFVASMGAILYATNTLEAGNTDPERAQLQGQARSILDTLTGSPGVGMDDADNFTRFGLLNENGDGISHEFMQHLCGPAIETDPTDGRIDYGSVTRSIGLDPDDGTQFRLRIQPAELPYTNFPDFRMAYIGQIDPLEELEPPHAEIGGLKHGAGGEEPGEAYIDQLNSHFTATAVSELKTMRGLGTNYDPMPDVYGSSMEGVITTTVEVLGEEVELTADASEFYLEEALHGDTYYDNATYLEETLVNRLDLYDVLVVGSHVDHSELAPLDGVASDWVLDGGIVLTLGSAHEDAKKTGGPDWLDTVLAHGTAVPDTGLYKPFSKHPVFHSFHRLDPDHFKGSQDFQHHDEDIMEKVLPAGGTSHLSLSRCGALGDGMLARLSYTDADEIRYDEFVQTSECGQGYTNGADSTANMHFAYAGGSGQASEVFNPCLEDSEHGVVTADSARALLQNLIAYGNLQGLFIDFGPPIPQTEAVGHQMRIISYDHPVHGAMSVEAHVYTWIE